MEHSEKLRFYEPDDEWKMRLLKPQFHTPKRPRYDFMEMRRKLVERNAGPIPQQATHQNLATYRQCGVGGGDEKGIVAEKVQKKCYGKANHGRKPPA